MSLGKNQEGFTLIELLIATLIMALGFIAFAEMQFLSLLLKQRAELGSTATNAIQFISDRDMAEVKRIYLLNSNTRMDAQAGRVLDLSYCDGSATSVCGACPCDPLEAITPNPDDGVNETTCAAVTSHNFDPTNITFRNTKALCQADAAALPPNSSPLYIVKEAMTDIDAAVIPSIVEVQITYAIKTSPQFDDTDITSVLIRDSIASQSFEVTAHVDNYSDLIPGWTTVRIPHVP
ncbi:MAG TPA: prepilin-type N-terminal cleavage/methylation domain-containing protein [Thermodesulfobacteriota bacterium]|nr:prepilin-type N-terminal cleavage/methylation domain-containing protein [Thermodesulfobacteriota bacterium]